MTQQWASDPEVLLALEESRVRRGLWTNTIIWMPLFIVFLGLFLFFLGDLIFDFGKGGTVFLLVIIGGLGGLFGFQGLQSVFDLIGKPRELEGFISRRWARSDSFVLKSHYIRMDKNIIRIERAFHGDLQEGDYVRIRYYPHSSVLVHADRIPAPEGQSYVSPDRPSRPGRLG